jgi:hypothetical protein
LKKTKNSIFGGISKFHLWANFGNFLQFWADFPAFTVAESMPEFGLKSSKPHNFSTMNPNVTCNGYWKATIHIYSLKKVSKNPKNYYIHSSLPKDTNTHFG